MPDKTREMEIAQVLCPDKAERRGKEAGTGGCGICLFIQKAFRAGRNPNAEEEELQEVRLSHCSSNPSSTTSVVSEQSMWLYLVTELNGLHFSVHL